MLDPDITVLSLSFLGWFTQGFMLYTGEAGKPDAPTRKHGVVEVCVTEYDRHKMLKVTVSDVEKMRSIRVCVCV